MKREKFQVIVLLTFIGISLGGVLDTTHIYSGILNSDPIVTILTPYTSSNVNTAYFEMDAIASDSDGSINRTNYYLKNNTWNSGELSMNQTGTHYWKLINLLAVNPSLESGAYILGAKTYDQLGASAINEITLNIAIGNDPLNLIPRITINSPLASSIIKTSSISLSCNIEDDDGTILSSNYWIKNTTWISGRRGLQKLSAYIYRADIDISIYTTGSYEIWVNATDNDGGFKAQKVSVSFKVQISREITENQITYQNDSVTTDSTASAYCFIDQDQVIQSIALELKLPTSFSDATNLVAYRGFQVITPDLIQGTTSYWDFVTYSPAYTTDKIEFLITTPQVKAQFGKPMEYSIENATTGLTDHYIDFLVTSEHDFTNVSVIVSSSFNYGSNYLFRLYRQVNTNQYEEMTSANFIVDTSSIYQADMYFDLDQIDAGNDLKFRIICEQQVSTSISMEPFIYGIMFMTAAALVWFIISLRVNPDGTPNIKARWGSVKFYLATFGILGGTFAVSSIIMYFTL